MRVNIPAYYDIENILYSHTSPSSVHCDSRLSAFFRKYLLQRAMAVYDWGMPSTWKKDFVLYCTYCLGYVAVFNTDKFGVIAQPCGLSGYDVFYQPTNALISNPLIRGDVRPRIGVTCELLKLQPDYTGILDLVSFHGDMMALCASGAGITEINSRLAYVFGSDTKAGAETFKKLYDTIAGGNPAAVTDKQFFGDDGKPRWQLFLQNVGQNYIADKQLENMRRWEQNFDKEIGIPWANTGNLERANSEYILSNRTETAIRSEMILQSLQESCDRINNMFGDLLDTPLSVRWRHDPMKEVDPDDTEPRETVNSGDDER